MHLNLHYSIHLICAMEVCIDLSIRFDTFFGCIKITDLVSFLLFANTLMKFRTTHSNT